MSIQALLKEKLDRILFLEVNIQVLKKVFNVEINQEIYLPIQSSKIIDEVKYKRNTENLNIADFVEGMFYILGADPFFKFSSFYESILLSNEDFSKRIIKKVIYKKIQNEELVDAYVLLNGLAEIDESEEVYSKLLLLTDTLRKKNKNFKEEMLRVLDKSKSLNFPLAYYYQSILYYDEFDYEKALLSLSEYLALGGESNNSIEEYKKELEYMMSYSLGKEMVYDNPKEALMKLLPLLEETRGDAVLYYYIAIAYRIINNYEKAVFYLNEAFSIDSEFVDVINELGLNYACLGNYNEAIRYFRSAFEASQSIEICTNIIMCYSSMNNKEKVKEYIEIGKKIAPNDEILVELQEQLEGEEEWN